MEGKCIHSAEVSFSWLLEACSFSQSFTLSSENPPFLFSTGFLLFINEGFRPLSAQMSERFPLTEVETEHYLEVYILENCKLMINPLASP